MSEIGKLRDRFGRLVVTSTGVGMTLGSVLGLVNGAESGAVMGLCTGGMAGLVVGGLLGLPGYQTLLRLRHELLEQVGERLGFDGRIQKRTHPRLEGIRADLNVMMSYGKSGKNGPVGFRVVITGLPNASAVDGDGSDTPDALPGSDGFICIKGERDSLLERLGPAGCHRLYRGLGEGGWRLHDGTLSCFLHPLLWDVDELSELVEAGLAMVLHDTAGSTPAT